MIRLVYTSSATKDLDAEQLLGLLKSSRKNNNSHDVTGVLLYSHRTFFQVLEGDEETVEHLFSVIKKDKRHNNVTIIEKKLIHERDFPYWSMGYDKINKQDLEKIYGIDGFDKSNFNPDGFLTHKGVISPLLKLVKNKLINQANVTHEELPTEHEDPLLQVLHNIIRVAVKFTAIIMVFVIILGVIDVMYVIYEKLMSPPFFLLTINDMLATFGAFLAVLIAIEIFLNITLYIRSDVVPVKLVVATALMAISRKVIVFDFNNLAAEYVVSSSLVIIALGITYWLIDKKGSH